MWRSILRYKRSDTLTILLSESCVPDIVWDSATNKGRNTYAILAFVAADTIGAASSMLYLTQTLYKDFHNHDALCEIKLDLK